MRNRFISIALSLMVWTMATLLPFPVVVAEEAAAYLPKDQILVDGNVVYNDAAVQKVLENNPRYSRYPMPADFLSACKQLDLSSADEPVYDISVLQLCTNLETLVMDCSKLKSLAPLTWCTKLKSVTLYNVNTLSLEPLTQATNLTQLRLEGIVHDLRYVESMPKLDTFIGIGLGDVDLAPVAAAPKLSTFSLDDNNSECDISPIANARRLKVLGVANVKPDEFAAVVRAIRKTLQKAYIYDMAMSPALCEAIGACGKLTALELVNVTNVHFPSLFQAPTVSSLVMRKLEDGLDFSALSNLRSLTDVTISDVRDARFSNLGTMPKLKNLTMEAMDVDSMSFIANIPNLENMSLVNIKGAQFGENTALAKLKTLNIRYLDSPDLSFISRCKKVSSLTVFGCRPTDFSFLKNMLCNKSLESLALCGVSLVDLSFAADLPKLYQLILADTKIEDISAIAELNKLESITLYNNPITSYSPVKQLKKLAVIQLGNDLDSIIYDDIQRAHPDAQVEKIGPSEIADAPYEAAVFFGDENPTKRDARHDAQLMDANQKAAAQCREAFEAQLNNVPPISPKSLVYEVGANQIKVTGLKNHEGTVRIPETIESLPVTAISGYLDCDTLIVPPQVTLLAIYRSPLKNVYINADNPTYGSAEGVVFSKDMKELLFYPGARGDISYTIPEGVESISTGAFLDQYPLYLNVPASVSYVSFNDSMYGRSMLGYYSVSKDNPNYSSANGCLLDKNGTRLIALPMLSAFGTLTIPEGVTSLDIALLPRVSAVGCVVDLPSTLAEIVCSEMPYGYASAYFVDEKNPYFTSADGLLYSKDMKTLVLYPIQRIEDNRTINVRAGVEIIGQNAFRGSANLTNSQMPNKVIFPDSLREIRKESLTMYCTGGICYTIPASVTVLEYPISVDSWNSDGWFSISTPEGSAADQYCMEHHIPHTHP